MGKAKKLKNLNSMQRDNTKLKFVPLRGAKGDSILVERGLRQVGLGIVF